jgi:hypothetical protein
MHNLIQSITIKIYRSYRAFGNTSISFSYEC